MKKIILGMLFAIAIAATLHAAGAFQITRSAVQNPNSLERLLNAMDDEIDSLRTLANELRTDHATFKAAVDEIETQVEATASTLNSNMAETVNELRTWAIATATALNNDTGVDSNTYDATISFTASQTYDSTISNSAPAAITAPAVTEQVQGGK